MRHSLQSEFSPASTFVKACVVLITNLSTHRPPGRPDNRTFAERMMSRFGWEEGKGLGAQESGMTSALGVQRAPAGSKKQQQKKKEGAPGTGAAAPPQGMAGRSVVVDSTREHRLAEQRAQMGGDPSRVVLLTNLCARDEVDDDLGDEVAEEASKVGGVERCFVYHVPGETRDEEAVRIFLVMRGCVSLSLLPPYASAWTTDVVARASLSL